MGGAIRLGLPIAGFVRALSSAAMILCLSGCSLVSLKSPERPLDVRDLNARILIREYSSHFIAAVEQCAADITATEDDPAILDNTLRWQIAAVGAASRAATQLAPMTSVLDTWTLALQMRDFLSEGNAGGAILGRHQGAALAVAREQAERADALARRLIAPHDFERYQKFAAQYIREHPLENLQFARAPVVELWSRQSAADAKLVDSLGTIPEAMADVADRLQIYSDTLPSLTLWKTQLALRESGYSTGDIRSALKQLDARLAKLSSAAETAPETVQSAIADVRRSVVDVLDRLDASSAALIKALGFERAALTEAVRTEREAASNTVDVQRKAFAQDIAKVADQIVQSSGEQVRQLAREVLLLVILLIVVVLGLPFAAGYLVGRGRRGPVPTARE
jgi:hypothetical protein